MRRVVVTGLGIVAPVGNHLDEAWSRAVAGKSGVCRVTSLDRTGEAVQIAGEVKGFDATQYMNPKEVQRTQRFVHFAVATAKMALNDAGFSSENTDKTQFGVSVGVGIGGLNLLEEQLDNLRKKGSRFVSPFTIPGMIANMAAGIVSIEVGAQGPNICPTTACASGTHGIGEALLLIQTGRAQVMLAGGAESCVSEIAFGGFSRMNALTKDFNDNPEKGSRPFDKNRTGFVLGEGAGMLLLEEYEHAVKRGARIYCELVGYGLSSDAYHMTMPPPGGEGAVRCIRQALSTAGLNPEDIHYINAHGTSTQANDELETEAIKTVFGSAARSVSISSTKSVTGHLLGGAGGVEAVFSVMALKTGVIPPTINLDNPDEKCDLNYTPHEAIERRVDAVISNSFGFGGTNACLAFKRLR